MANKLIHHYNHTTGETIVREMTNEEHQQLESEVILNKINEETRQASIESIWQTKVNAYQKLGLTTEEIEVIAPTPKWLLPSLEA